MTALAIYPPGSAGAIVRQLFHHAWPILIAQLLSMAMMIADTLIAGRYGTLDLAGVAIGSSFYISVVMLLGQRKLSMLLCRMRAEVGLVVSNSRRWTL